MTYFHSVQYAIYDMKTAFSICWHAFSDHSTLLSLEFNLDVYLSEYSPSRIFFLSLPNIDILVPLTFYT